MIVVGRKGYQKDLGPTSLSHICQHCNNEVTYHAQESGVKFSLFFIPLFPMKREFRIACPICQYGYSVNKDEVSKYLLDSK